MHNENVVRAMPDIAKDAELAVAGMLDWVGMDQIDVPVRLVGEDGMSVQSAAKVAAYVNLTQSDVRGIHMSRLYVHVDKVLSAEPLTESLRSGEAVPMPTLPVEREAPVPTPVP